MFKRSTGSHPSAWLNPWVPEIVPSKLSGRTEECGLAIQASKGRARSNKLARHVSWLNPDLDEPAGHSTVGRRINLLLSDVCAINI